jgi:hypothetical protein
MSAFRFKADSTIFPSRAASLRSTRLPDVVSRSLPYDARSFTALAHLIVIMCGDDNGRDINPLESQALMQLKAAHLRHLQINNQTLQRIIREDCKKLSR